MALSLKKVVALNINKLYTPFLVSMSIPFSDIVFPRLHYGGKKGGAHIPASGIKPAAFWLRSGVAKQLRAWTGLGIRQACIQILTCRVSRCFCLDNAPDSGLQRCAVGLHLAFDFVFDGDPVGHHFTSWLFGSIEKKDKIAMPVPHELLFSTPQL